MDEEYASNGHNNVDLPDNKADAKAQIKKDEDEDEDELDRAVLDGTITTAADKEPPPEYSDLYLDTSVFSLSSNVVRC